MVTNFLGLNLSHFRAKKDYVVEDFTAYELVRLSQIFQTSINNLIEFD